jgi:hypothetical protein
MSGLQPEGIALVRPTDAAAAYAHLHIRKEPTAERSSERSANAGVIRSSYGVVTMSNPKTEPTDNTQKNPDEWVSGNDPMTGAQASYLKTLCEQAGNTPELFINNLTKAEASKLIDEMREKPHVT